MNPTAWITDDSIDIFYEYFSHFSKIPNVLLVPASTAALILYEDISELQFILEGLNFGKNKYWLIPVNDKTDPTAAGGMHWSLLYFDGIAFYHLDSKNYSANWENANIIAQKLIKLYLEGKPIKVIQEKNYAIQKNSYDCGMYVIAASEKICENINLGFPNPLINLSQDLTSEFIAKKRKEIYEMFVKFIKENSKK